MYREKIKHIEALGSYQVLLENTHEHRGYVLIPKTKLTSALSTIRKYIVQQMEREENNTKLQKLKAAEESLSRVLSTTILPEYLQNEHIGQLQETRSKIRELEEELYND